MCLLAQAFYASFLWCLRKPHITVTCVLSSVSNSLWSHGNRSPPGSSVHGILQARILEWIAISSSRGSVFLTRRSNPPLLCLLHWQAETLSWLTVLMYRNFLSDDASVNCSSFIYQVRKFFALPDSAVLWEAHTWHLGSTRTDRSLEGALWS